MKNEMTAIFIHGLDSSSHGTKASWFRENFPEMMLSDFKGSFSERMEQLQFLTAGHEDLIMIGSSFGGLMAAAFALERPWQVKRLILLAPALNFPEFADYPASACSVPTLIYLGRRDAVCPPFEVLPAACRRFANLAIHQADEDHQLRKTFSAIDWEAMLADVHPACLLEPQEQEPLPEIHPNAAEYAAPIKQQQL
jgi:pimeloyl-ACP methyl ester carboxylesterase